MSLTLAFPFAGLPALALALALTLTLTFSGSFSFADHFALFFPFAFSLSGFFARLLPVPGFSFTGFVGSLLAFASFFLRLTFALTCLRAGFRLSRCLTLLTFGGCFPFLLSELPGFLLALFDETIEFGSRETEGVAFVPEYLLGSGFDLFLQLVDAAGRRLLRLERLGRAVVKGVVAGLFE